MMNLGKPFRHSFLLAAEESTSCLNKQHPREIEK